MSQLMSQSPGRLESVRVSFRSDRNDLDTVVRLLTESSTEKGSYEID